MSDDEIHVCPECESPHIRLVSSSRYATETPTYRCTNDDCGERFDDPQTRPPKRDTTYTKGLAKRLAEMDATEVGDDTGRLYGTGTRSQRHQYPTDEYP